ncbi:hypothetical protein ACSFBX_27560 [Variovorax sp. RB2P76]|uniref:hypothetical protein n=1 Tax=Variovorax sp. RB2P76 TaxID=3443736 RepID=UPI003F465523
MAEFLKSKSPEWDNLAAAAPGAAWATSAIVAMCIAIGGTIAISLFTDWDYVELPFGIKLKRKPRN